MTRPRALDVRLPPIVRRPRLPAALHPSLDHPMKSPLALIVLVVGIALLLYGLGSADSIKDSFSRLFTGHPTDRTMWFIVGGSVLTIAGLGGFWRASRA